MNCKYCGAQLNEDALFCSNCGAKVESKDVLRCPNCGAERQSDDLFCENCGIKFEDFEPAETQENAETDIQHSDINNEQEKKNIVEINNTEKTIASSTKKRPNVTGLILAIVIGVISIGLYMYATKMDRNLHEKNSAGRTAQEVVAGQAVSETNNAEKSLEKADWVFSTKDADGNSWYVDKNSIEPYTLGEGENTKFRCRFAVKLIPGEKLAKTLKAEHGQPIASVIEEWDDDSLIFSPSVGCKFYDAQGKLIADGSRDDGDQLSDTGSAVIDTAYDMVQH